MPAPTCAHCHAGTLIGPLLEQTPGRWVHFGPARCALYLRLVAAGTLLPETPQ